MTIFLRVAGTFVVLGLLAASATARTSRYTIVFPIDSVKLTPGADALVGMMAKEVTGWDVHHIVVIGYADTADKAPLLTSRYRAKSVADRLRQLGVPETITIEWIGKGTDDLAMETGPGVSEPQNRRVMALFDEPAP